MSVVALQRPEIVTKGFRIRLLERGADEWERFNELIRRYHYLHSLPVGGRTWKVVCECVQCGEWLALLDFRTPPLGTYLYIRKIFPDVTDPNQVLVNTRFLVMYPHYLPRKPCHDHFKGSIALSKAVKLMKMINRDVKVIVSYVDTERGFEGTIYRAANFVELGESKGINIKRPVYIGKRREGEWRIERVGKKKVFVFRVR